MSERKRRILEVALELFANDGYAATSTNKIARESGVSEGLIFRHYGNKQGLLLALVDEAAEKIRKLIAPILDEENPKKVLEMAIEIPFSIPQKNYDFWRLQFKLKWEKDYVDNGKMKPLLNKLADAFSKLGYSEPQKEAEILNHIIESISVGILRDGKKSQMALKEFLLKKYLY